VDVLQVVHAWMSDRRNGQWLMILDNVDDDGVFFGNAENSSGSAQTVDAADYSRPLESFLPQTANGTILITSRNRAAAINLIGGYGSIVQVEPMGEEDALALLHTRVPFAESGQADAKALVHALERIPLAITHAAAYIKTRASTTTISTYLELFRESEANQVNLLGKKEWKDIRRDHSIRHAVITTWQISFKHIRKTEPSAADLLALISMFDKQGIPRWLLQANTSQLDFDDALAPLLSFSLVRTEIGEQALEMHRLVQLSMRTWLEAEKELSKWVKKSIQALAAAFPNGDYKTWEKCKVLLPHVKEVVSHTGKDGEDLINEAKSALGAGWYLFLQGEYKVAEGFLWMSTDTRERVLGPEHPDTLTSVSQLGSVLESQGKYEEAEAMHQRALEGREKVIGPEHPDTLTSVSQLGSVLSSQGKYEEAEAMHQRALEGREKVLGPEQPDTLTSVNNLGSVLERQGKYEEAEVMHQRALEGYEKVLGPEHPHTLTSVSNLGSVLERQGKYEEAEAMYQRALEGRERVLGPEHPDTLTSVSQLGSVLSSQGKYEEAEAMHQRALEGREKVLGLEHPDTLTSVYHLAFLLHRQQHYSAALELYQRAYDGRVKALGARHPRTLACLYHYKSARKHREV
jgi:tetratricopeptide (TPR) repeat protein